jgi:teichuronic acid biosynthesis glycosyltransferase TuaC
MVVISHLYPQRTREHFGVFVSEQVRALSAIGAPPLGVIVPVPMAPWPLALLAARWRRYAGAERNRTDFVNVPVDLPRHLAFPRKLLSGIAAGSAARAIARDAGMVERIESADVLVAHSALLDGAVAHRLSHRYGVPYVVVVHGEDLYRQLQEDSPPGSRAIVSRVLSDAAAVVAVSNALAGRIKAALPGLERVRVVHNGVDGTLFTPADPGDSTTGGTGHRLRTLSAGHLVARKGNDLVLRAIAALRGRSPEIDHTIAGDGPEMGRLRGLAAELGIADRVRFVGGYRHVDLPALMRECDLFVMPSWDEAFGVVYLEAMASGVPVVAASDGGASDIVTDGVDGRLVPPRDVAAIADAMAGFAAMAPADREQMSSAARRKAESFTWEASALGLLGVLGDAVSTGDAA